MIRILFFALYFLLTPLSGISQETSVRKLDAFKSISVSGPADVKLVKGQGHSVKIESVGFAGSEVKTTITESNLRIQIGSPVLKTRAEVDITITYEEISRISCEGACNIFSSELIQTGVLELQANAASVIEAEVQCKRLVIDCSTAGQVIVSGNTGELKIDASTSGTVDANALRADKVVVQARTASGVKVQASESLQADVSTAASLRYRGNPSKTNLQSSTGGGIRKVD